MTAPKRRWFRISLVILVVAASVLAVWLGWNLHLVKERQRVRQEIGWRGARLYSPGFLASENRQALPRIWAMLGAEPLGSIELPQKEFIEDDRLRIQSLFPEADVSIPKIPPGMGQGMM